MSPSNCTRKARRLRLDQLARCCPASSCPRGPSCPARASCGSAQSGPCTRGKRMKKTSMSGTRLHEEHARGHEALAHRGRAAHAAVVADQRRHEEPHAGEHVDRPAGWSARRGSSSSTRTNPRWMASTTSREVFISRSFIAAMRTRSVVPGVAARDAAVGEERRRDGRDGERQDEPARRVARRAPRDPRRASRPPARRRPPPTPAAAAGAAPRRTTIAARSHITFLTSRRGVGQRAAHGARSLAVQRQRLEAAGAVRLAPARRDRHAGQAQAVALPQPLGLDHPVREDRRAAPPDPARARRSSRATAPPRPWPGTPW